MNNKAEQIKVYVMIGTIVMLLVIFSGITYAFFSASNNKGSTSLVEVTSGKMIISYADGKSSLLVSNDIVPSSKIIIDKTFTLTGTNTTSGLEMTYKVGIKYTNEFSNGQLHYYIKRTTSNSNITSNLIGTGNQTIPGNTAETGYTNGIFIKNDTESYLELASGEFKANTSNQTITFNLKIQFPDTGENQDSEKGKSFTGEIVVNYENETGVDYITKLYNEDKENNGLLMDDTSDANIRYSGSDSEVKNFVEFGNTGELWRIIGIFNVTDSNGVTSQKLKLVRNEAIGSYSWDTSKNNNKGINDWSKSDLMKELNGDYLDTTLTANKTNWYNSYWTSSGPVFRQTGIFDYTKVIKEKYQNMISESVWNLGANTYNNPSGAPYGLPTLDQYNKEKGTITYQNSMPTTWTGKIGLIYASDYGYASTDLECRNNLRAGITYNTETKSYDTSDAKCPNNNWLSTGLWYWTISPDSSSNKFVFRVYSKGIYTYTFTYDNQEIYPSLYLLQNIKITSGTGEKETPYKLSL